MNPTNKHYGYGFINKKQFEDLGYDTDFDKLVNQHEYYNCNAETGKYCAYYIESKPVDIVKITCYDEEEYLSREAAMEKYALAMQMSDGSERDRYVNIYTGLIQGLTEVSDEEI